MGRINSKQKGKSGEREIVNILKDYFGEDFTRNYLATRQKEGDILSDFLDRNKLHFEVKRREQLDIRSWVEQAQRDVAETKIDKDYAVLFRKNDTKTNGVLGKWHVVVELEFFLELLSLLEKENNGKV